MKFLPFCAVALTLSACGLQDVQIRNSDGLVSKSAYNKAIASATLVQDADLRGQILKISRATVRGKEYGVLQFVGGAGGRRDQPNVGAEVLPLAERALGCAFPDRRKFGEGTYMPRNAVLVLPMECVDLFDG